MTKLIAGIAIGILSMLTFNYFYCTEKASAPVKDSIIYGQFDSSCITGNVGIGTGTRMPTDTLKKDSVK